MSDYRLPVVVISLVAAFTCGITQAVTIETVPVGNPGNAGDTRYATPGYGAVGYDYRIGKYEVTAGQYTEFLNAVAKTDVHGLYDTEMWSEVRGCQIRRTGESGNYSYDVAVEWAKRPANYISWGDAARFANWLHNGQPRGAQDLSTTEDGAYYLNGATSDADLLAVNRKSGSKWALPTEDEWYKAAYHKNNGVTGDYWDYPTASDITPSNARELVAPDPGNCATYYDNGYTGGWPTRYRTEVGEHENSGSSYDTFDQGGNVFEWNEAVWYSSRGLRGGSFNFAVGSLRASYRDGGFPSYASHRFGFRVVYVPEPATLWLMAVAGLALLRRTTR